MTANEAKAAVAVLKAVVETIREAGPQGAPRSSLFLALQTQGCSIETYQGIENALIAANVARRENDCLIAV